MTASLSFLACLDAGRLAGLPPWALTWQPAVLWLAGTNNRNTRRGYAGPLRDLMTRFNEPLSGIGEIHLLAYKAHLVDRGLSPRTIRHHLSVLAGFFDWLIRRGDYLGPNPAAGIPLPRVGKEIAGVALDQAQLNRLYGHARTNRDGCILRLLAQSGLRAAELCALQQRDLHLGDVTCQIHVRSGKGGKARDVAAGALLADKLAVYLTQRRWAGLLTPLFQTYSRHDHMSYSSVYWIVRRAAERAGLGHITPHDLRRTYCTLALKAGVCLPDVQKAMGHSLMEQTARYFRG